MSLGIGKGPGLMVALVDVRRWDPAALESALASLGRSTTSDCALDLENTEITGSVMLDSKFFAHGSGNEIAVMNLDEISRQIDDLRSERDVANRSRGYRLWNRRFHEAIHLMAHSRVMAETSRRMWDLSDFLINTTGSPNPLSPALDERHEDHERIRAALHEGDQQAARAEMESHIVRTFDVIKEADDVAERADCSRPRLTVVG